MMINKTINYKQIMKIFVLLLVSSSILTAKDKNSYIGIAIAAETTSSYLYEEDALAGIMIRSGYEYSKNFGLEVRGSMTLGSEEKLSHDYSIGLYVKPKAQLAQNFTIYGLLGYGLHQISFSEIEEFTEGKITKSETSLSALSYGVGMEYNVADKWSLFLEGMQVVNEAEDASEGLYKIDVKGVYFGVNYRFNTSNKYGF